MPFDFKPHFERALPYRAFLEKFGTPEHRERWENVYQRTRLTTQQLGIAGDFRRKMPVLCMAGTWCGDCVNGCPIFQKIAEARPDLIDLRFINRVQKFDPAATDADTVLANEISILAAPRVPMLVFFTQDMFEACRYGERTLLTYREKGTKVLGASCSTGLFAPPADAHAAVVAEWFEQFERVQLMLLTSPRLMKMNGEV
jgi:thiol-disulfide isomerase/thioredoxin